MRREQRYLVSALAIALLCIGMSVVSSATAAPGAKPTLIGVADVPNCHTPYGDPTHYLHVYHAQIYRVIVQAPYSGTDDTCIARARKAHAKIEMTIQWDNHWNMRQIKAFFAKTMKHYGPAPYIGIGNEQELNLHHRKYINGVQYSKVWKQVKPIVRHYAPHAKLIAGEVAPSSARFLKDAFNAGLPGAQIIGAHPYTIWPIPGYLAIGRAQHLPVWFDEGLAGPHAWPRPQSTFTRNEARGAEMAAAWLAR